VAAHLGRGADRFLLEMRGVPFRSDLKPGTLIVTSGLGNVFPRGIPIGVVLRETKTIEGWARTYLIRPIVSPDASSAAMVLLPARAAAGVTGAWASVEATDNAQKTIVMAGDSIIADSVRVIQDRLAKLSLLDSLRRAAIYGGDSGVRVESDSAAAPRSAPMTAAPTAAPTAVPPPVGGTTLGPAAPLPTRPLPTATAPSATAPSATAPPRSTVTSRVDSLARAAARARAGESARAKTSADSAQVKGRSLPIPPDSPLRLPPAGGRA